MQMRICYGEYHASADGGVTQLLYVTEDEIRYWITSLKNCKNQKHISQN